MTKQARNYTFDPAEFAAPGIENPEQVANLRLDLVHTLQPVNAVELLAVERIALAHLSMLRVARLAGGLMSIGVLLADQENPTPGRTLDTRLAEGFRQLNKKSDLAVFLRYQAQSERLYRRAIEDFDRIKKLRTTLPHIPLSELDPTLRTTTTPATLTTTPATRPSAQPLDPTRRHAARPMQIDFAPPPCYLQTCA